MNCAKNKASQATQEVIHHITKQQKISVPTKF